MEEKNYKTLSSMVKDIESKFNIENTDLDDEDDSFIRIEFVLDALGDEDKEKALWYKVANAIKKYCKTSFKNEYTVNSWGEKDSKYIRYTLDEDAGGVDNYDDNQISLEFYLSRRY